MPDSPSARLRIYGVPRTRAFRVLWMATELGLDYENIPVEIGALGARLADYLAINPNGRLPAIDDGGFVMWESLAINLYLAKKHSTGGLYPATLEGEARSWQWSLWAANEVDRTVSVWSLHALRLPPGERDQTILDQTVKQLTPPFKVLDAALAAQPYLVGQDFCVADLNVAAVISRARKFDLTQLPHMADWLGRCLDRPAALAALKLRDAADAATPAEVTRNIAAINRPR